MWAAIIVAVLVVGLGIAGYFAVRRLFDSGIASGFDAKFGDQHLKTTVALVELHKLRNGRYPARLEDLRFVGDWDRLALQSVSYVTNPEGSAYYLEVERGWMGKPALKPSEEFWRGTGYSPALRPTPTPP